MSFTELEKSRGKAGFEETSSIMQCLRCLVDTQVEFLMEDLYFTGEDMDLN